MSVDFLAYPIYVKPWPTYEVRYVPYQPSFTPTIDSQTHPYRKVKAVEYNQDGSVKRIEYYEN